MKKSLLFAAIAAVAAVSCSKSQSPVEAQDPLDDGTKVPVLFSTGVSQGVKSTGSATAEWNSQTLKIYSYETNVADFSAATPFIDNVSATAPVSGSVGSIVVTNPATGEPFYYVAGKYYDFYGYYIDDAATSDPSASADGVYVPFTINGSQDLMIAKADQDADITAAGASITADKAYSAYAARRGVQPNLIFKHQLARFTFEIVAGDATATDIIVESISIKSVADGQLKVVGSDRGIVNLGTDEVELMLQEMGSNGMQALTPVKTDAYVEGRTNAKTVGESLMVIPGKAEYQLSIQMSKDGSTTTIDPYTPVINIADINGKPEGATTFDAGYSYKITIVIYGLQSPEITAELEDWKDGGATIIDPDL